MLDGTCSWDLFQSDLCLSVIDSSFTGFGFELLIFLVAFVGLAIAAEHLCNSMETLCDHWRINEDIGGATFIALGSAIPEITINCIATFKSVGATTAADSSIADVGVGAILGSGLIAFLLIPALSCLIAGSKLLLRNRSMYRDATFYGLALVVLTSAVYFGIRPYHAPILVSLYICYVLVLVFSDHLRFFWSHSISHPHLGPTYGEPTSVFREKYSMSNGDSVDSCIVPLLPLEGTAELFESSPKPRIEVQDYTISSTGFLESVSRVGQFVISPIQWAIDKSCPDCRIYQPSENMYPLTFITSFVWITLFSFIITIVVGRWVVLLNLPTASAFFGLVLVAAGAEIPDTVNSVTITKRGFGGMAIGACMGSQVVNICLGLGMPWLITSIFGQRVPLSTSDSFIHHASLFVLATVVLSVVVICVMGPKHAMGRSEIDYKKALALISTYLVIVGYLGYATLTATRANS